MLLKISMLTGKRQKIEHVLGWSLHDGCVLCVYEGIEVM